jgi:ATP phosphoribosyltransferase regulatory subunit
MNNGSDHRLVQVPPGVQCFVGEEARRRRAIEDRVISVFEGWDYDEIIPPLYDYADVFTEPALAPRTYSFVGRDGSLLALRPDFTSLLAKIAAGRLSHLSPPIRLYYSGEVLRYEPPKAGRQSELYQMGLEHLGGDRAAADVEVLAIAAECLEALAASGFVLALGHVGLFAGLVENARLSAAAFEPLRERVEAKDVEGVREVLRRAGAPREAEEALVRLTGFSGGLDALKEAPAAFACSPRAQGAALELSEAVDALRAAGLERHLAIDLGEVRGLDYYTGLVFRAYVPGLGFEVGGGGRYDTLLARFGRPMPAVGFMLGLDRVALLLERQDAFRAPLRSAAEPVSGPLGAALSRARVRRAAGARVRFDREGPA